MRTQTSSSSSWSERLQTSSLGYAGPDLLETAFNLFVFVTLDSIPSITPILFVSMLLESSHAITKPFSASYSEAISRADEAILQQSEQWQTTASEVGILFRKKILVSAIIAVVYAGFIGPLYPYLFQDDNNEQTIATEQTVIFLLLASNFLHLLNHTFENLFKGAKQPLINFIPSALPLLSIAIAISISPTILTFGLANLVGFLLQTLLLIFAASSQKILPHRQHYQLFSFKSQAQTTTSVLTLDFIAQGLFQITLAACLMLIMSYINKLGTQALMLNKAVGAFFDLPRVFLTAGVSEKMKVLLAAQVPKEKPTQEKILYLTDIPDAASHGKGEALTASSPR